MPSGPAIPHEKLNQLKAQLLTPADDKLSFSGKVRRLQSVLRDGERLERDHPDAANGHLARATMLDAARQLAMIESDAESQSRVFELAKRIISLPGPPEGKIWADYILTQERVAQLTDKPETAVAEINGFVSRFSNSPVEPVALMAAVEMASKVSDQQIGRTLTTSLLKYRKEPAVEAFLRDHFKNVFKGYSLNTTLTTMDGATLRLPRDVLGRITVLYFWTVDSPDIPYMRLIYDRYHDRGVDIIGINLDTDRGRVEEFIRQQGLAWPVVFSGLGVNDPLFKRLGISRTPFHWIIKQDGTVLLANLITGDEKHANASGVAKIVDDSLSYMAEYPERLLYYRSGEFLAFSKLLQSSEGESNGAVSKADIDALRARLLIPPSNGVPQAKKIESFKEALSTGKSLEKKHPDAGNLPLVRAWMLIAARWLAITTGDNAFNEESLAIAKRIMASNPAGVFRSLADYVLTSAQLVALESGKSAGEDLIRDYAGRYSDSWGAQILASMLAIEDGQDGLREELTAKLVSAHTHRPGLIACAFLRDVCKATLPDDVIETQLLDSTRKLDESEPDNTPASLAARLRGILESDRLSFFRSGEFMALAPLLHGGPNDPNTTIPSEEFDAFRGKVQIPGPASLSQSQKTESYKDILATGGILETNYPLAGQLQHIRAWMLIAAKWLAVTAGDKAYDEQALAIAGRILGANPTDASGLLADYVVTCGQLSKMEPHSKGGAALIQDFVSRHELVSDRWAVELLAVLLTYDNAAENLRPQRVSELRDLVVNRPSSMVYGFLREFCDVDYAYDRNVQPVRLQLTRMDGQPLVLPDDLLGKVVILQFWTAAHPPIPLKGEWNSRDALPYTGLASYPPDGVVVVGVNLDRNRAQAEALLKKGLYPDWIHTYSGSGWDDKSARLFDVESLPKVVILNRYGEIAMARASRAVGGWAAFVFKGHIGNLVKQPATRETRSAVRPKPQPTTTGTAAPQGAASPATGGTNAQSK